MDKSSQLTISGWCSRGWSTYKANLRVLIGASVVWGLLGAILFFFVPVPWGSYLFNYVIGPPLFVGTCFLHLKAVRGEQPSIRNLFAGFSHFGKAWLTYIFYLLIVTGGMFLLVVPGIIWAAKYNLSLFAVLDRSLSARKAIGLSSKITYGYKGKLLVAGLIGFLIVALFVTPFSWGLFLQQQGSDKGTILLTVGIVPWLLTCLVISPWFWASWASAYDSLVARWQESSMMKTPTA